jgi:putative OPT family oligopeptide transporter
MNGKEFKPYVPVETSMTEFTLRALLFGLVVSVILGAANAYLGLRAGMTIAATYPAAVLSMAILRLFKGSLLEENFFRTVGSIGESVAAGAVFTIPAFVILGIWKFEHFSLKEYAIATALMIVGGLLGILFVTVLRRVMVEDRDLPFPESVAAGEIHKAGQRGAEAAMQLFRAMGVGALIQLLGNMSIFKASNELILKMASGRVSFGIPGVDKKVYETAVGGTTTVSYPAVSPAYMGVGYIIGPALGALNFAGGLLAWGLFVPLLVYFLGPHLIDQYTISAGGDKAAAWGALTVHMWKFIVRPIAVGGMLVGAAYTLYMMRKNLWVGLKRAVGDLKKSTKKDEAAAKRTDKDLNFKVVLLGIIIVFCFMLALYFYFSGLYFGALLAAVVMLITGFFFAAVSGNLVGMIGSSNNPVSGLTLATLIIAAGTMVLVGAKGIQGVAAVLGVAAVVCVSSAVAGEMLQDLKVGHILGGTPWKMQTGDIIGIIVVGLVMYFPLFMLHVSNKAQGGVGFGDKALSAPQAGLMATLSQGIVGGEMAWPLVLVGIVMGICLILVRIRSPMLFSVGMYLPLETTFAIFIGGIIRGIVDLVVASRSYNDAQKARVENAGILAASGLIAGEALMGLLVAAFIFIWGKDWNSFITARLPGGWPAGLLAIPFVLVLVAYLVYVPLKKAGRPDEPAPPTAVM